MNLNSSVASGRWRRAARPAAFILGLTTSLFVVSACGQKGALTMPAPATPVAASASTPAAVNK